MTSMAIQIPDDNNDKVVYNQAIGEVGRTGRATGSHLHYEVLYNGRNVNPLTFVNIRSMNKS